MSFLLRLSFSLLFVSLLSGFNKTAKAANTSPRLECKELSPVIRTMQEAHYAKEAVLPVIHERVVNTYIKMMDSSRTLFLDSEVKSFRAKLNSVFSEIYKLDCSGLSEIAKLSISRVEKNEEFVRNLLNDSFKVDENIELELDSEKRGYAKTETERLESLRKLVHFQILSQTFSGTKMEKAKSRVLHRYKLVSKRVREKREISDLPELFAESFASSLDPHSSYLSAEALADFQISMRLSLEGIGAVLRSEDGFTQIQSIVAGGAADKEGSLRAKDKLIAVAQKGEEPVNIIDMDLGEVVKMIRGKKGTTVILTVLREGADVQSFDVAIVRDKIDVREQAAKIEYETRNKNGKEYKIGVLTLPSFYQGNAGKSAVEDTKALLKEAKAEGVDGLVLDLSENGGGLLSAAVQISGLFLSKGAIVATDDIRGDREILKDQDPETQFELPMAVLISSASASASEILAGALQDYGRAVIVGGKRSFGKGTVQQIYPLPYSGQISGWDSKNGAMKVTIGMFFRPSGSSTQHTGVESDIVIPNILDSYGLNESELDHSLPHQQTTSFKSLKLMFNFSKNSNEKWTPVTRENLRSLKVLSSARVENNETLKEIQKANDEDQDDGPVKLSEIRKKAEERKQKEANQGPEEDEKDLEKKKSAFIAEAVNVVSDLLEMQ